MDEENVKRIDALLVHDRMVGENLELFLYLNNEECEIPKYWHKTNKFMELEIHFSIMKIFDSMYADLCSPTPSGEPVVIDTYKDRFDALKKQLEEVLAEIENIEYVTKEKYKELHSKWVGLTDEEIEGAIDEGFALGLDDGNVSNKYVIRYARVIEAKLKEKNSD